MTKKIDYRSFQKSLNGNRESTKQQDRGYDMKKINKHAESMRSKPTDLGRLKKHKPGRGKRPGL